MRTGDIAKTALRAAAQLAQTAKAPPSSASGSAAAATRTKHRAATASQTPTKGNLPECARPTLTQSMSRTALFESAMIRTVSSRPTTPTQYGPTLGKTAEKVFDPALGQVPNKTAKDLLQGSGTKDQQRALIIDKMCNRLPEFNSFGSSRMAMKQEQFQEDRYSAGKERAEEALGKSLPDALTDARPSEQALAIGAGILSELNAKLDDPSLGFSKSKKEQYQKTLNSLNPLSVGIINLDTRPHETPGKLTNDVFKKDIIEKVEGGNNSEWNVMFGENQAYSTCVCDALQEMKSPMVQSVLYELGGYNEKGNSTQDAGEPKYAKTQRVTSLHPDISEKIKSQLDADPALASSSFKFGHVAYTDANRDAQALENSSYQGEFEMLIVDKGFRAAPINAFTCLIGEREAATETVFTPDTEVRVVSVEPYKLNPEGTKDGLPKFQVLLETIK